MAVGWDIFVNCVCSWNSCVPNFRDYIIWESIPSFRCKKKNDNITICTTQKNTRIILKKKKKTYV